MMPRSQITARETIVLQGLKRPILPRSFITLAVALFLTFFVNDSFIHNIASWGGGREISPLICLLFLLNLVLCQLFSIGRAQTIWLLLLITIAAFSQYFMQQYGVLLDKSMLQNALETDNHEVAGLLNVHMLAYVVGYIVLPAMVILLPRYKVQTARKAAKHYAILLALPVLLSSILIFTQYQSFAPVLREHRDLKHLATPFNSINAAIGLLKTKTAKANLMPFQRYAEDARRIMHSTKPQLVVMVLGETVRADHLGINGYSRNTTPGLAQQSVINLGAISSCGTATAISVPCMFSYLNQQNYDEAVAKNSDNVLDVMQRAGVKVIWRDNNSGCKGMCERVEQDQSFINNNAFDCKAGSCPDSVLLNGLAQKLRAERNSTNAIFVVLHQQGNHGPEYFKRSLAEQKQFFPECETNLLNECQQQEIINAYDNAILATDELLNNTITLLQSLSDEFDTSMLYVSDHGESLGENGVYLHGLPYWMAPDSQTKVPLLMWFSEKAISDNMLNTACIKNNALQTNSHDMLFDSLLDLMQIETRNARKQQDIFWGCHDLAQLSSKENIRS